MDLLEIDMLDNAVDFLSEAIDYLERPERRNLKYVVLHLASATEIALKARLVKDDWREIFDKPESANRKQFDTGDFRSIQFNDALDRLEGRIEFDLSEWKPIMTRLRNMRNRIQHFRFSAEVAEITSVAVKTWSFFWDFIHDELADDVKQFEPTLNSIRERMEKHKEFVKQRLAQIRPEIETRDEYAPTIVQCPWCFQDALKLTSGTNPSCYFCRASDTGEGVADRWAIIFIGYPNIDVKDTLENPLVRQCPSCGREALVGFEDGGMFPPDPAWVCFSCAETWSDLPTCSSCGELFVSPYDLPVCSKCCHASLDKF